MPVRSIPFLPKTIVARNMSTFMAKRFLVTWGNRFIVDNISTQHRAKMPYRIHSGKYNTKTARTYYQSANIDLLFIIIVYFQMKTAAKLFGIYYICKLLWLNKA